MITFPGLFSPAPVAPAAEVDGPPLAAARAASAAEDGEQEGFCSRNSLLSLSSPCGDPAASLRSKARALAWRWGEERAGEAPLIVVEQVGEDEDEEEDEDEGHGHGLAPPLGFLLALLFFPPVRFPSVSALWAAGRGRSVPVVGQQEKEERGRLGGTREGNLNQGSAPHSRDSTPSLWGFGPLHPPPPPPSNANANAPRPRRRKQVDSKATHQTQNMSNLTLHRGKLLPNNFK